MKVSWPFGHKFTFTIFDDSDWATIENIKPVYDLLTSLNMRTTKSVWVFRGKGSAINEGMTCEDNGYLKWLFSLQKKDFEIGLHNVAPTTSNRDFIYRGLDRFQELFGRRQIAHCNHVGCQDSIYWGDIRLSGWRRLLYNLMTKGQRKGISKGHLVGDSLFWGDLCQERVRYVRNFVFDDLNSLKMCPEMPYHDPTKPFVNFWYASADGGGVKEFLANFTYENIDRLVEEGGACIAYVHFAGNFAQNGKVDPEIRRRLEYISSQDGWFAPVSEVLDYLSEGGNPSDRTIPLIRLRNLETRWLTNKVLSKK